MMSAGGRYPPSPLPTRAEIVEVGLRDGFQALERIIPTTRKLGIIDSLTAAGVRRIQVASFVHPERVPQMADAEELCARLPKGKQVTFSALILNEKGVERALAAGIEAVDMGIAATDSLNRRNAGCTVEEGMKRLRNMVRRAKGNGLRVRAGIQAAFGCAYEGKVARGKVVELVERTLEFGIDELSLADSTGMANPLQVEEMISAIRPLADPVAVVLHLHDTRGLGLANVYAALRQGVRRFDTAFGGLGGCPFIRGATGNIATEDTVAMMKALGIETGIDIAGITSISRDLEALLETPLPARMHHLM